MDFAFKKKNYIMIITGFILILSGLALMIGGGSDDPQKFSYEIFNLQRLTIAPILIASGFILEVFAIMYRDKS
tara:strand:- start:1780 stop:1998 length:219 start_codon:yes stop_codon:yes gene_type:complete